MVDLGWCQAMIEEMSTLHSNGTWKLVPLSPGKQNVGCHWVYIVKIGHDGHTSRLKAHLVAKGYTYFLSRLWGHIFPYGQNNFCSYLSGYCCYSSLASSSARY